VKTALEKAGYGCVMTRYTDVLYHSARGFAIANYLSHNAIFVVYSFQLRHSQLEPKGRTYYTELKRHLRRAAFIPPLVAGALGNRWRDGRRGYWFADKQQFRPSASRADSSLIRMRTVRPSSDYRQKTPRKCPTLSMSGPRLSHATRIASSRWTSVAAFSRSAFRARIGHQTRAHKNIDREKSSPNPEKESKLRGTVNCRFVTSAQMR